MIGFYEKSGYIAQLKKNGTCTVISIDECGDIEFWNRHKEIHKAWVAPQHIIDYFKQFPDSVFVGELLHNKSTTIKNTIYLFDVLVYRGIEQVGETLNDRLNIIKHLPDGKNIIKVENIYSNFRKVFDSLTEEIDEGLVFKDPESRLKFCYKDGLNANWQVKCRKLTKNYSF
jgi:hypothetical protein